MGLPLAYLQLHYRQLDPTCSGRIPHHVFLDAMPTKGETLPRDFVLKLLHDVKYHDHVTSYVSENRNQQPPLYNYERYCKDVVGTSSTLLSKVKHIACETEQNYTVNSRTYKVWRAIREGEIIAHE